MLGFDFATFVFQIVNFLILLAILARFFYRPVLEVMQRRQSEIDARLEDADRRARQAEEERKRLAEESQAASRQAAALVEAARDEAAKERQRLLESARVEAASLIDAARKTAAVEEQSALERLSSRLSQSAVTIAGAFIRDASGEAVHRALLERLLSDGLGLDAKAQEQAKVDLPEGATKLVVESAYALDASQEQALRDQAARVLGRRPGEVRMEVREAPALIAGVRVLAGALVIDMSVKHLLEELSNQEGSP